MVFRILDATSFYAGVPFLSQETYYTTPQVFEEIKHIKKEQGALTVLVETGRLKIVEPKKEFREITMRKSEETGDYQNLSNEDVSVIGLALQLEGCLITDDFAISNVAKHLNLEVNSIMTNGVTKEKWVYLCPGCHHTSPRDRVCNVCGNRMIRRLDKDNSS